MSAPVAVHWLAKHPAHYLDVIFRAVAADPRVALTVHYMEAASATHPWRSAFGADYASRGLVRRAGVDWGLVAAAADAARPSVFVVNGWDDPTSNLVMLARGARGLPFAIWTDTPRLGVRRPALKARARAGWLAWLYGHATWVMGTGQPALDAHAAMGAPRAKLVNFPFAVDLDAYAPRPGAADRPAPAERIVLVSTGRLINRYKAYDVVLDALAEATRRLGHCPFRWRLGGTGPDEAALRAQAAALGLAPHVDFAGWLEPAALPDFYRSGDVCLHPSRIDNYGISIVEAMACGLPVIGSDGAKAAPDRVRPGETGWIVPAGEVAPLADALCDAWARRAELPRMGQAARRTAEAWPVSYNVEALASRVAASAAARWDDHESGRG